VLGCAGCGASTTEEQLLTTFFQAARLHDRTRLAEIATVSLNPRTEGTVERFEVVSRDGGQVTVNAQLRTPDGRIAPRAMRFTIEARAGRPMITGLEVTPPRASRTSPAASSAPPN
jgi:hypothetical protein